MKFRGFLHVQNKQVAQQWEAVSKYMWITVFSAVFLPFRFCGRAAVVALPSSARAQLRVGAKGTATSPPLSQLPLLYLPLPSLH